MTDICAAFFDIDNTLFDTRRLADASRRNAVRAMIESGLDADEDDAYDRLMAIVKMRGSNYGHHYDELLEGFGREGDARLVAAGIVAYHATKTAYLVPYPDTVPTLIGLRDRGVRLGVITDGLAVKQWEKLIRLGLQHFFDAVVISESEGKEKPETTAFFDGLSELDCKPDQALMVGDRLDKDILGANIAGMTSVQILRKHQASREPASERETPDYVIGRLSELLAVIEDCGRP